MGREVDVVMKGQNHCGDTVSSPRQSQYPDYNIGADFIKMLLLWESV